MTIWQYIELNRWRILARTRFRQNWFLCSRGIGDTTIFLSKLKAYKEKYPDRSVRLIVSETHESIVRLFSEYIDEYRTLPYETMCKSTFLGIRNYLPSNIKYILPSSSVAVLGYKEFDLSDLMNITLELGEDTGFCYPSVSSNERIKEIKEQILAGSETGKLALIAPNAVSIRSADNAVWKTVCEILLQYGYNIVVNSTDTIPGLNDYKHISYSLDETLAIIDTFDVFVSLRSGLCDLLAFGNCPMIVLYPNEESKKKYSLLNMGFENRIFEVFSDEAIYQIPKILGGIENE